MFVFSLGGERRGECGPPGTRGHRTQVSGSTAARCGEVCFPEAGTFLARPGAMFVLRHLIQQSAPAGPGEQLRRVVGCALAGGGLRTVVF